MDIVNEHYRAGFDAGRNSALDEFVAEIECLRKQLAASIPLLDEAADKIDELEAKLKFAETTLEEIRNEDANKTINYYCDETLAVLRGK